MNGKKEPSLKVVYKKKRLEKKIESPLQPLVTTQKGVTNDPISKEEAQVQ